MKLMEQLEAMKTRILTRVEERLQDIQAQARDDCQALGSRLEAMEERDAQRGAALQQFITSQGQVNQEIRDSIAQGQNNLASVMATQQKSLDT